MTLSRRGLLTAAAIPFAAALPRTGGAVSPPRLTLPDPTGPYPVGVVDLHLAGSPELMASIWYPAATDARRYPLAPWMPDGAMRAILAGVGFPADAARSPITAGHLGAPVRRGLGRRPVILSSSGHGATRADSTIVVQELASHGYVVGTVDQTYDAYVEFPDGRVLAPVDDPDPIPLPLPADYARNVLFVLDRIEEIAAGHNPDAEHRRLPDGLGAALDLRRVGMLGWSKGGTATALAMISDRRIRAGLGMDGPMQCNPPISTPIARPFLMMTAEFARAADPQAADFWALLHGWRRNLQIDGALESAFVDQDWLLPQLARLTGMSDEELRDDWTGSLDPARAVKIQQAYPLAFFDRHLQGRTQRLLDGPSPAFPEIRFIP